MAGEDPDGKDPVYRIPNSVAWRSAAAPFVDVGRFRCRFVESKKQETVIELALEGYYLTETASESLVESRLRKLGGMLPSGFCTTAHFSILIISRVHYTSLFCIHWRCAGLTDLT